MSILVAENFESSGEDEITIVFTTIQGLHAKLNTPRENAVTYEDFADKRIVLLSDEAHHINAETKKAVGLPNDKKEELVSWEGTVNRIFSANKANLLLEFTATIDLAVPEIKKKYADKILFNCPLKQFRTDGYSKEVKILQTDLSLFKRAVQTLLKASTAERFLRRTSFASSLYFYLDQKPFGKAKAFMLSSIKN